jgi:UrcA family protein
MRISTTSALSLAVLLLAGSVVAVGAPRSIDEVPKKTVNLRDLDLATADGARTLYYRITSAARTVCRGAGGMSVRACRNRAVDEAVSLVDNPILSSIHRSAGDRIDVVSR